MTDYEHTRVLSAYLMRLPPIVFKRLLAANLNTWDQQLNGNNRGQLDALEAELDVIRAAVESMTEGDKAICARIVRESVTETA
jgi:hypothetical protein